MLSTNHYCRYVYYNINVLKLGAFNFDYQYFIPLFNKISWLCKQPQGGDETSNEGCKTQAQQGMTLRIALMYSKVLLH